MKDKLFSTEPETAVLSILLKNPEKAYDLDGLKPFMFSADAQKLVFDSIHNLSLEGYVPERSLLESHLESRGVLDRAGGSEYLDYLTKQTFDEANLREFTRIIENSYKARSILSLSSKIPDMVLSSQNVDSVLYQIRNSIEKITEYTNGEGTFKIGDLLPQVWEELDKRVKNPDITGGGSTTGFNDIDLVIGGYRKGDLIIIAGRPGSGKTAWLLNSALKAAKKGVSSLIFEHEMSKQAMVERMLASECGIPIIDIRLGKLDQKKVDRILEALESFKSLPIYIDTTFGSDIEYLKSTTKKFHKLHGINVVFADYLQLMVPRTSTMRHELGTATRDMKILATQLEITMVAGSQLSRAVELRDDKRPILSDLRESGNIEEDADIVGFLYRDVMYHSDTKYKDALEFNISKHRNGPVGMIPLKFTAETNLIQDG